MGWIKNIYWRLNEVSCVLVLRNKMWFQNNIEQLERVWRTIEKERISGDFSHRAPNKRSKKVEEPSQVNKIENYFNLGQNLSKNLKIEKTGCLIPLPNTPRPTSRKNSIVDEDVINSGINTVIKIRTESIDETKQNSAL
jgi:hypothetical protein